MVSPQRHRAAGAATDIIEQGEAYTPDTLSVYSTRGAGGTRGRRWMAKTPHESEIFERLTDFEREHPQYREAARVADDAMERYQAALNVLYQPVIAGSDSTVGWVYGNLE